jgi:hypothetical protein
MTELLAGLDRPAATTLRILRWRPRVVACPVGGLSVGCGLSVGEAVQAAPLHSHSPGDRSAASARSRRPNNMRRSITKLTGSSTCQSTAVPGR